MRRHARELVIGRRAIGEADHLLANRAVRHELADVHADAACLERLALRGEIDGTAAVRIDEDRGDALRKERRRVAKTPASPSAACECTSMNPGATVNPVASRV